MVQGNSLLSIFCSFENNGSRSLGSSIRANVDVSTNNVARRSEQILQILPTGLVRQLAKTSARNKVWMGGTTHVANVQLVTRVATRLAKVVMMGRSRGRCSMQPTASHGHTNLPRDGSGAEA